MTPNAFIKSLRLKQKGSQEGLAKRLGISRSSYIAFEQGKRELSFAEAVKLCEVFTISLEEIQAGRVIESMELEQVGDAWLPKGMAYDEVWERISVPQEHIEKFKQVLCYIISKVGAKPNIGQTVLYKLLYFIDFDYFEKFEEQLIGARYIKNTHGPTPVAFAKVLKALEKEGKVETVKSKFFTYDQTKYLINHGQQVNLSTLSANELAHIDWELGRLSDMTATQISDFSHKDTPWIIAKNKEVLEYDYVFYRPEETSVREYEPF